MIDLVITELTNIVFKIKAITTTDTGSTNESGDITIIVNQDYTPSIQPPLNVVTTVRVYHNADGTYLFD